MNDRLPFTLPFPTFEDLRKMLQFWIDQQEKWFYFEGPTFLTGSSAQTNYPNALHSRTATDISYKQENIYYFQTRIVAKIGDIVEFPPSLLLHEAIVITVQMDYSHTLVAKIAKTELRPRYGLVFSQITYYEPINDHKVFLEQDDRVRSPR